MLLAVTGRVCAQQVDPALTAAVVAQTAVLNDIYNTRDNTQKKIWSKKVLLLISSASTGKSITRAIDCLQYYSGELVAVGAIFSAIDEVQGIEVKSLFTAADLPSYDSYPANECPLCKGGRKVDALINSFGYSKL